MANRRAQPVSYRPFRADPLLPEGLLGVALFRLGRQQGLKAEEQAEREGEQTGRRMAAALAPRATIVEGGGGTSTERRPGQPFRTGDPVAADLPPHARAFLNAVAGGESAGAYNVRFTPEGGAFFNDLSQHPRIYEQIPPGMMGAGKRSSAAGRYQFVASTWDSLGGGDFSPENQDRQAWRLALRDYRASTGRDLDAELQAQGLTPQVLKALTPTWEAFKANQQRHIATYQQSLERYGGAGAGRPQIVSEGGAPFQPGGGNSPFHRSFDQAGTRAFLQIVDNEIRMTTAQAFELHKESPAALNRVLDELKAEQLRQLVPAEIRGEYEIAFEAERSRYLMASVREANERAKQADLAAFQERSNEIATDLERRILQFDPASAEAAGAIHAAQTAMDAHYDSAVERGLLRPEQAMAAKLASRRDTAVRFYARQADEMSPEETGAYRRQLEEDFRAGTLDGIDAAGFDTLTTRLEQMEGRKRSKAASIITEMDRRGSELADRVGAGFELNHSDLNDFVLAAGDSEDAETVPAALAKIEAAEVIRSRPIAEAFAHVEAMRQALGKNPTPAQISAVAYAENRLSTMMALIEKDAAGYAIATGQIALEPIDLGEEALESSLATRREQMEEVAARYDRPLTVLRPAERAMLARALVESPDAFPRFAKAVHSVFGEHAGTVLAEIGEDAPVLAHAAGLAIATGDDSIAADLAQAISAKQKGEFKAKMPAEDRFIAAAAPQLGTALAFMTGTRANVLATAALLLERDANLYGFDATKVADEGSAANIAMRRAVDRAVGAQVIEGVKTGGVAEVNGAPIVAPAGMPAGRPQRLIETLSERDLEVLPPIRTGNDITITASHLRRAHLVTVGDGLYRVALGDPLGFDPQYVVGEDGDFWILDLNRLDRARREGRSSMSIFDWRLSDIGR